MGTPPPPMDSRADNPLIVQSDLTILLEVHSPRSDDARAALAPFAEMVKSPEHVHTYRLTPLSIWNARATGLTGDRMVRALHEFAKYAVPDSVAVEIRELARRYGRVTLSRERDDLRLATTDRPLAELLVRDRRVGPYLRRRLDETIFLVDAGDRGAIKQALVAAGHPAEDLAGYVDGESLAVALRDTCLAGGPFMVREYQRAAAAAFYQAGSERGGSGVIALPCGSGKTIVGLAAMAAVGQSALVLTTSLTSVRQWRREIADKTTLPADAVAEYTGEHKDLGPVTLTTYQVMTWRPGREEDFPHLQVFRARRWGLIIYDEVHLLPAPVFRVTAELQARRRLGLTATLVREDGREEDVFALIGPKRYDVPWRDLEKQGWIAEAGCTEIRLPLHPDVRMKYALAEKRERFRVAAENPAKAEAARDLLDKHADGRVLIIGEYLDQLQGLARDLATPLITGKTPQRERDRLYEGFRQGDVKRLILSRVGNFALDLPDADVLLQVSGMFGSRQEEAQRLGRILRPKRDGRSARFYTLVSRDTCEEDFAHHRQLFLAEQGYSYRVELIDGIGGS